MRKTTTEGGGGGFSNFRGEGIMEREKRGEGNEDIGKRKRDNVGESPPPPLNPLSPSPLHNPTTKFIQL